MARQRHNFEQPHSSHTILSLSPRAHLAVLTLLWFVRPLIFDPQCSLWVRYVDTYIEFYNVRVCDSSMRNRIVKDYTPYNLLSFTVLYFTFTFIQFLSLWKHLGRSPLLHSSIDHHSRSMVNIHNSRHKFLSLFPMSNSHPLISLCIHHPLSDCSSSDLLLKISQYPKALLPCWR